MKSVFYILLIIATLILIGCDETSKEVEHVSYQISTADSTRMMNEILDGIIYQGRENQRIEVEFYEKHTLPPICHMRMFLQVVINSKEEVHVTIGEDSLSIQENVFNYYTFNRELTSAEIAAASTNSNSPHFEFPFFNRFGLEEFERKIEETTAEANSVRQAEGADPSLIEYFDSKVEEWEKRKRTLEFLKIDELPELGSYVRMNVEYREPSPKLEEVLKEVAMAFYQLRNHYSLMYFNETYLRLYERTDRLNRKIDRDKMEAVEILQPISLYIVDRSKASSLWESVPEPQAE